eukprot:2590559-Amphidinium_carterae.3
MDAASVWMERTLDMKMRPLSKHPYVAKVGVVACPRPDCHQEAVSTVPEGASGISQIPALVRLLRPQGRPPRSTSPTSNSDSNARPGPPSPAPPSATAAGGASALRRVRLCNSP